MYGNRSQRKEGYTRRELSKYEQKKGNTSQTQKKCKRFHVHATRDLSQKSVIFLFRPQKSKLLFVFSPFSSRPCDMCLCRNEAPTLQDGANRKETKGATNKEIVDRP